MVHLIFVMSQRDRGGHLQSLLHHQIRGPWHFRVVETSVAPIACSHELGLGRVFVSTTVVQVVHLLLLLDLVHGTPPGYFLNEYHISDSLQALKLIRAHRGPTRTPSFPFISAQRGLGSAHGWLALLLLFSCFDTLARSANFRRSGGRAFQVGKASRSSRPSAAHFVIRMGRASSKAG